MDMVAVRGVPTALNNDDSVQLAGGFIHPIAGVFTTKTDATTPVEGHIE